MRGLALMVMALVSLTLAACANDPVREGAVYHQAAAPVEAGTIPTNVAQGRDPSYQYRLGVSDKVRIITFNEASLTGEFVVNGSGTISLPLIGDVKANGLSTSELAVVIQNALKNGYITNPQVSVEVLNYRPFYILGEVTKPGEYPFANGLTVLNAVATANGFTYRADTHRVFIKRANETAEHEVDLTTTTPVEPGDTIRIKERLF
jgi:protein involved in polysaccharide export with SLBB domain